MAASRMPTRIGHMYYGQDGVGRVLPFFGPQAAPAADRFTRLRSAAANLDVEPLGSAALALLCLIVYDLVINKDDLGPAWSAVSRVRCWRRRAFISWEVRTGMWQRRFLSDFSCLAVKEIVGWVPLQQAVEDLNRALHGFLGMPATECSLDDLQADGAVWAHAHVAPYLACAITGQAPMACLPDSALARESAQRPLAPTCGHLEDEAADENSCDGAPTSSHSERRAELWSAIDGALSGAEGTKTRRRNQIARRLESLLPLFRAQSEASCFLLWCVHLVRVGTPRTMPVVPETGVEYIRQIGPGLLECVSDLLENVGDARAWRSAIDETLKCVEPGSVGKANAALAAFHAYCADTLDAAPLASGALGGEVDRIPRANVFWPCEHEWILEQLSPSNSGRFRRQVRIVFLLLRETGGRSSDIFSVRMDGVQMYAECAIVSIDPRPGDGQIKTRGSRREVEIREKGVVRELDAWLALRRSEGAEAWSLLFGCPDGKHLPWRRSESLDFISQLLKAATGDPSIGPHALRHSDITHRGWATEFSPSGEQSYHSFSASKGHGADVSTRRDYDHSSDLVLAREMDELNGSVKLTLAATARWIGTGEVALRKAASRSGQPRQVFVMARLAAAVRHLKIDDVTSDFSFARRCRFDGLAQLDEPGGDGLLPLLLFCRDLGKGCSVETAAARHLVSIDLARSVATAFLGDIPSNDAGLLALQVDRAVAANRGVDFGRLEQDKYKPLLAYASSSTSDPAFHAASVSWQRIRRGKYLSLESPDDAEDLLRLLAASGVKAQQLIVCSDSDTASVDAVRLIRFVFSALPQVNHTAARGGRPRSYLQLMAANDAVGGPSGAGTSGLGALMLVASISRQVRLRKP